MKRVIPGIILGLVWLMLIFLAPLSLFGLVIALIALLGAREFQRMGLNVTRRCSIGLDIAVLLPVLFALSGRGDALLPAVFASSFLILLLAMGFHNRIGNLLTFLSRALFMVVWIGAGFAHLVLLKSLDQGVWILLFLSMITVGSDTGAYYAGRAWGRSKLCPDISPGKTIAGAVGGLALALFTAFLTAIITPLSVSWLWLLPMVAVLTVVGIIGDLTESMVKRATGVKDSGTLLAGHGGVLDRGDSLLLTAPLLYYLLVYGIL